jgi:chaperone modulatory protein CbpM
MSTEYETMIEGQLIDNGTEITLVQLCRSCAVESELVERLVAEGILEPVRQEGDELFFPQQTSIKRTQVVVRLRTDLGVNLAGAALVLELLERIEELRARLRRASL